ncbi:MAG: energy transducer TonB [Luteibaculaceae bacterium]
MSRIISSKIIIVLFLVFGLINVTCAQSDSTKTDSLKTKAQYPGGETELFKFLSQNTKYPQNHDNPTKGGVVFVGFEIDKFGLINNVRILRGLGEPFDSEVIRVIKSMPAWEPATNHENVKVNSTYNLPIRFSEPKVKKKRKNK